MAEFFTAPRIEATIEWATAEAKNIAALPDFDEKHDGRHLEMCRNAVVLMTAIKNGEKLSHKEGMDRGMAAEYVLMAERGVSFC